MGLLERGGENNITVAVMFSVAICRTRVLGVPLRGPDSPPPSPQAPRENGDGLVSLPISLLQQEHVSVLCS
jgi:hypothetical protein